MIFVVRSTDNKVQIGTIVSSSHVKAVQEAKKKFRESSPIIDLSMTERGMEIIKRLRAETERLEK